MKFIFHIDMDAFFASVEEQYYPQYKNKPLVVTGRNKRSVVCSCNYIARNLGIKAAMPFYKIDAKNKDIVFVEPHFDRYEKYSEAFIEIIKKYFTKEIEVVSIDECYLDASLLVSSKSEAVELAKKIQKQIKNELGITASIGISSNKFLAKMASDMNKPNGITTLFKEDVKAKLWPLPIEDMFLIGKKTATVLKDVLKIKTIGNLANFKNFTALEQILGQNWIVHIYHANGSGNDKIDYDNNYHKTMSLSHTFINNTNDENEIKSLLISITKELISKMNNLNYLANRFGIILKTPDNKSRTISKTLQYKSNNEQDIMPCILNLFEQNFNGQTLKLVGVAISNIIYEKQDYEQLFLFEEANDISKNKVEKYIVNEINYQFNSEVLSIAKTKLK